MKRVFPEFQFTWLVEETKKNLPLELDFLNEGKNSEKLQVKFSRLKFLKVFIIFYKFYSVFRMIPRTICIFCSRFFKAELSAGCVIA